MAHTYELCAARTSSAGNPVSVSVTTVAGSTVMVLMLKIVGGTDRAGGDPSWGGVALMQAGTTQKAASSPEAGCELWYLLNPIIGTRTLTIPNTGALTLYYTVACGKAAGGAHSAFDVATGANNTSTNPSPGSVTTKEDGDIGFAITAGGWQTWAPSAQAGTIIANTDDGANGGGEQYHLQSEKGATTLGWTFGTSDDWGAVVAYFKEVPANKINNYMRLRAGSGLSITENF